MVVASAQFSILITGNKTKASQAAVHHRHHREQFIIGTFGGRGRRAPGPGKERSTGSRKERHEAAGGRAPGAPRRRTSEAHVHQGHHGGARAPARGRGSDSGSHEGGVPEVGFRDGAPEEEEEVAVKVLGGGVPSGSRGGGAPELGF